jgi:predicted amidohydrolase YtcJ
MVYSFPSYADSHIHIGLFGESQYFVDLSGCYSIEELQQAVIRHIAKHPTLPWVTGVNWDQTKLGRYPTRQDLAAVQTEKPVCTVSPISSMDRS